MVCKKTKLTRRCSIQNKFKKPHIGKQRGMHYKRSGKENKSLEKMATVAQKNWHIQNL